MPPIFDAATITRFAKDAEENFVVERPCIVDRVGLDLVAGTALYDLPSTMVDVRRVTYLGWKVYPLPHRDLRQTYLSGTQQSRPYWYIINNVGQNKIQLFPVPSVSCPNTTSVAGIWGSDILSNCIVEFYRQPDQVDNIIPDFIRRRLLKCYVNKRCFEIDAKGNNLKNVKYWNEKYEMLKDTYSELLNGLNNKPRFIVASGTTSRPFGITPPPPVLPIDRFGVGVDEITG